MKKYSKPFIDQELIEDINETLCLYSGSDYFASPCYPNPNFEGIQRFWSNGQTEPSDTDIASCTGFVYTVGFNTDHVANPSHTADHQYIIFELTYPDQAEDIAGMMMDSTYQGYFNDDSTRVLFPTGYTQNDLDRIGSGGIQLQITFAPGLSVQDKKDLYNSFSFSDTFVRCGYYIS